jgi:hypothetical protein
MTQQSHITLIRKTVGYSSLLIAIIIVIGLFFVNYLNEIAFLIGITVYFLLKLIIKSFSRIREYVENFSKTIKFAKTPLLLMVIIALCLLIINQPLHMYILPCRGINYRVIAIPETTQLNNIRIQEYVTLKDKNSIFTFRPPQNWIEVNLNNQTEFQLPERTATIENRGFLLKEVAFSPPIPCNGYYESQTSVKLVDFPLNSFYAAHDVQGLQRLPYLNTETITWNSDNLDVKFGYIPPPYQFLQTLLRPLIGASLLNQWLIGIIGIIGTFVFVPFISPVFTEIAQSAIKNKINNTQKATKPTAKLIVSDKGDEKEIEIKNGKK